MLSIFSNLYAQLLSYQHHVYPSLSPHHASFNNHGITANSRVIVAVNAPARSDTRQVTKPLCVVFQLVPLGIHWRSDLVNPLHGFVHIFDNLVDTDYHNDLIRAKYHRRNSVP